MSSTFRGGGAEGVPPAEAVARGADADVFASGVANVAYGLGDDGVSVVFGVGGEELRRGEVGDVDVDLPRGAVEHVRRHRQVARSGEAVGEAGGYS